MGYLPPPRSGEPDYVPKWYWRAMFLIGFLLLIAFPLFVVSWGMALQP